MADAMKMLAAIAGLGTHPQVIDCLIDFAQDRDLTLDERRYLVGPVIVAKSPWSVDLPDWVLPQVRAERVEIVLQDEKQLIVGPTEILAAMYGHSLDGPMTSEAGELYCWAGTRAVARLNQAPVEPIAAAIGDVPDDRRILAGNSNAAQLYRRLATDIRSSVIRAAKDRVPAERNRHRREAPAPAASGYMQLNLFGGAA